MNRPARMGRRPPLDDAFVNKREGLPSHSKGTASAYGAAPSTYSDTNGQSSKDASRVVDVGHQGGEEVRGRADVVKHKHLRTCHIKLQAAEDRGNGTRPHRRMEVEGTQGGAVGRWQEWRQCMEQHKRQHCTAPHR